jgi:hypothetical protein
LKDNLKKYTFEIRKLPEDFIPPSTLYEATSAGICCVDQAKNTGSYGGLLQRLALNQIELHKTSQQQLTFDHYCPSIQEKLTERTCEKCDLYFPSKAVKTCNNKIYRKKYLERLPSPEIESDDELSIISEELQLDTVKPVLNDDDVELIEDYASWTASYFKEG